MGLINLRPSVLAIVCVPFVVLRDKLLLVPAISWICLDVVVCRHTSSRPQSMMLVVLLLYASLGGARLNQCFLPNGSDINAVQPDGFEYWYIPCNTYEGQHGMCCQIGG